MSSESDLPLKGIRVVDYTHFLAGPYAARCLSAFGAEVIKVESPNGDAARGLPYTAKGRSGFFLQQNVGKYGICVDAKKPDGLKLLHKLVSSADVFIENFRPGALDRLGLGYKQLSEINPGLIYCSLSAYGHTGEKSRKPGFGLIAEAMSGAMAQVGRPGEAPPLLRMPIADTFTGVHGVAGICAALYGRTRSGRGKHIDLALYDCMVAMHDHALQRYTMSDGSDIPEQAGTQFPGLTIYGSFAAKDGYLVIAAQVDEGWAVLARLIGGDELSDDPRFRLARDRNQNREVAVKIVDEWVRSQPSRDDCIAQLEAVGVACAPIQTAAEVIQDEHLDQRHMFVEQKQGELGKVRLPGTPFRASSYRGEESLPAPSRGEHNRKIAENLGYGPEDIDRLIDEGVLRDG